MGHRDRQKRMRDRRGRVRQVGEAGSCAPPATRVVPPEQPATRVAHLGWDPLLISRKDPVHVKRFLHAAMRSMGRRPRGRPMEEPPNVFEFPPSGSLPPPGTLVLMGNVQVGVILSPGSVLWAQDGFVDDYEEGELLGLISSGQLRVLL